MKKKIKGALILGSCALVFSSIAYLWKGTEIKAEVEENSTQIVPSPLAELPVTARSGTLFPGVTWKKINTFVMYGATITPAKQGLKVGFYTNVGFGNMSENGKAIPSFPGKEQLKWGPQYTMEAFQPIYANVLANDRSTFGGGFSTTTAPLIFGQGDKVQEPLNDFGHGNTASAEPAALISNVAYYSGRGWGELRDSYLKVEYELKNNPAIKTENTFPYHVKVVTETTPLTSGRLKYITQVTNVGTEDLTDFVLGSRFDTDFLSMSSGKDTVPVSFLGSNRGIKFDNYRSTEKMAKASLNFYFDSRDRPDNWSVKQLVPNGAVRKFYDPAYTGFSGPTSTGQENGHYPTTDPDDLANAPYAYAEKDPSVSEEFNTAVYMKNQPNTLKPGESEGYTFDVSASVQNADQPYLNLDEETVYYDGKSHTVKGSVLDFYGLSNKVDVSYSMSEAGPFKVGTSLNPYKAGSEESWTFDLTKADIATGGNKTVYVKATNNASKVSQVRQQKLIYNEPPTLSVDKSIDWFMTGSAYKVVGKWKEIDTDDTTVDIYYSLDDGPGKILGSNKNVSNSPANVERSFAGDISSAELGNTKHKLSVWVVDSHGGQSLVESFNIGPYTEPAVSAELAISTLEILEGEKVGFTSTFQNKAPWPSLWEDVQYETTEAFPEHVDVDLTTVKLNGSIVPTGDITFGADRKLKVKIGSVVPSENMVLTYDVVSKIVTPTLTTPFEVRQGYKVSGKTIDATNITTTSGELKSFTINPRIDSISTLYLEEGSNRELAQEPNISGQVGEQITIHAKKIDGFVLSKVVIDDVEQEAVSSEVKLIYGENHLVKFYYTGVLEIKSAPTGFDFGVVPSSYQKVRIESAVAKGDPLVITDNRLGNQNWTLNVTLTTPLSNKSGKILPDVIRYKNGNDEIKLRGEGMPIVTRKTTTTGDYSISDTWSSTGDGFKMEVAPGIVNELGDYHAEILFEMGITP